MLNISPKLTPNPWDVSQVGNMEYMFFEAASFNQPLKAWDVGNVQTMASMFAYAPRFNQPLGAWKVSALTTTNGMFIESEDFDQGARHVVTSVASAEQLYLWITIR